MARPTPKANEILVRNHATTVTAGDCELRSFTRAALSAFWLPMRFYVGLFKPTRIKILGQEVAGEVEDVGRDVTQFKVGDQVFAATGFRLGGYAEYICLPETGMVALKPANMSYAEATAVPLGGLEAWHYLKRANIQAGQTVLINGAGGSIGTIAVQIAKHLGAEVTAVDHTDKLSMLRTLGADHTIDYTQEDFTQNGQKYDIIFDVVGKSPYTRSQNSLNRSYPLAQAANAHRYVEAGRKKGNVVITLS